LKSVYLFSSPRVGTAGFVQLFNLQMHTEKVDVFRITKKNDPVIVVPYAKDGFRHVGS